MCFWAKHQTKTQVDLQSIPKHFQKQRGRMGWKSSHLQMIPDGHKLKLLKWNVRSGHDQGTNDLRWQSGWLPFPWPHWSNKLFIPVTSGKKKQNRKPAGSDRIASDTSLNLIKDTCKVSTPSGPKQPKHWMVPGLFVKMYTNLKKKVNEVRKYCSN